MRILIAEDEYTTRLTVQVCLEKWGYRVSSVADGKEAWELLTKDSAPEIAILDWEMPGIDGVELCRKIKELDRENPIHVIMLTARDGRGDILKGFDAGADDYITKPFNDDELRARIRVAERVVRIQEALYESMEELRQALDLMDAMQNSILICESCSKIQDEEGGWHHLKKYADIANDSRFEIVHCPVCSSDGKK